MLTRREITVTRVALLSYANQLKKLNPVIHQAKMPEIVTILQKLWEAREDLPKKWQAWVWVEGAQYSYWNPLEDASETEELAQAVVRRYEQNKELGLEGFRPGPPSKTKITEIK